MTARRCARPLVLRAVKACTLTLIVYPVRQSFQFFCESSLLRTNHSTLQRGMLHTAAEGGTATEGDREGGRGAGEGDLGVGEGPGGGGGGGRRWGGG